MENSLYGDQWVTPSLLFLIANRENFVINHLGTIGEQADQDAAWLVPSEYGIDPFAGICEDLNS